MRVQIEALGGTNLQSDGGDPLGEWLVDAVYDYARVIYCLCAAQFLQLYGTCGSTNDEDGNRQMKFTYDGTDFVLSSTQHTANQWKLLVGSRTRSKGAGGFSDIHAEMVGQQADNDGKLKQVDAMKQWRLDVDAMVGPQI